MSYKVVVAPRAKTDLADFAAYAAEYSDDFARDTFERLNHVLSVVIADAPHMWSYFFVNGAPYRAYLFRVARRTQSWIVDNVDEVTRTVNVLRIWNASREPEAFEG